MKKRGLGLLTFMMALVLLFQGLLPMSTAQAAGDVIIQDLTAKSIFDDLGDALNYGTVAREWEQNAHAETSACVDYMDRYTNTIFANTGSTYFHAMNYTLEVGVSAPKSLNGMKFALYKYENGEYVRCAGTEKTITSNDTRATLTWDIGNELKNTRLYVFQTDGDGYIANGQENSAGMVVSNGPSLSSSAHNNNYIGKMVYHKQQGEGDSLGIFNTTDYSPSLTFGPETRAYYKKWNQELQQNEYFVIDPNDKDLEVQNVLINYYYTDQADFVPERDDAGLKMGYMKMDGMSFVKGQFVKSGHVIGVTYVEEKGYADKLLDQAEKVSKEWGNLGGGQITSLIPDTTGGSTVTGPKTEDGYVVSLYDMEVGEDGIFQVKKDTGWNGIPVAENEYVIINLICPSKDGKVQMGTSASDITYFYKEGQTQGEGVAWGGEDSNSSQRVIFNFVYADENGVMQPFEGTIEPTARHGGTLLAPKAFVKLVGEVHNGAIIANKVNNGQEIHQRNLAPLNRKTWIKMDGGYLTLDKIAAVQQFGGMWSEWIEDGPLGGAVFGVYSDEACTQLVDKITTDENGVATSGLLAAGDYWVKEITPPDGYGFPTDMWNNPTNPAVKVTVVAGDEPTKVVGPGYVQWGMGGTIGEGKFVNTQTNTQYGDLRVEKIISDNGKPLQGVTFGIYTRNQGYVPGAQAPYNLVGTMTTNRNGVAVYYDLPISTDWYGRAQPYYVKEISAPDGYKISNNNYVEVYLTADGMVTADGNGNAEGNAFANDIIRGNMALKKVDSQTNANLEGAEFTIYSDRNCTQAVGVMTTKRGGDADSRNVIEGKNGLIPGYYYVKETKAPEGYLLPENPTVYTVHVQPDKMVDVVTGNEIARAPEATGIGNDQAINITGTKVWYDEGFEGSRPQEVKIDLYKDTQYLYSATASAANNWTFEFKNLPRYDEEGKEINYIIKENLGGKAYDYYTYINEVDADGNITATVANSIKKTKITGKKVWEDTVQYDPDRPNDITFYLFQQVDDELVPVMNQDGTQMKATGSNWNGYKFEFINLPSYDAKGNKAEYVVQEAESDKYVLVDVTTGSITDQGNTYLEFILKNRLTVPLSGTKVWQDSSNADGNRPENVTLVVYRNGERMQPQPEIEWDKETDADVWTWKVSGLPKYDENNNLLTYSVKEERVPRDYLSYTSEDGLTIYNYKPGSIRLYKVYLDENNKNQPLNGAEFKLYWDEACQIPASNTVYTTAHAGPTRDGFIEINNLIPGDYYIREEKAPEGFALPVPNKPIKVTVIAGQMSRVNGEHGVVVNVPDSESTTIAVTKAWAGDEDKTDARPESITVQLYQNNAAMDGKTMELTAANNWQGEFTKLPGKDANGNAYTYTVKETAVVPGYLSAVTGSVENGFTITNTYNYTSISVKKEWKGLATLEGLPEVTVQLKANDVAVDGKTVVLSSANNWEASFDQLPIKDENGSEIAYSVEETTVLPDFNVSYSGDKDNGFVVTNTVAGGQITLKKVDGDNGNALSGAKFGIYSDKECQNLVAEMTTGNDGTATSEVIMAGTYYVKEIQAPQNYQISMKDAVEVTVVKDQTVKAQGDSQNGDFTNLKRALVYIKKVEAERNEWGQFDANSAKPLAGAEFTIYSDNNCTQVVAVLVTDENGYAEAALVPGRQYWVKETKAPAGYEIVVTDTKDFWANMGNPMQLTWGNWDQNINGAMVNVKTVGGAITLTKADAQDSSKKLSGAVFGVYSDNACQNLVAQMPATDANGVSTLEHIAVGTWYVKEITAPEGYQLNDTVYTVTVQANQTAQVNNGNAVTNEIKNTSVTVQLAAKKTLNGSSNVPSGYYSFELYEVVNGQQKKLETVQNVAGDVAFSEITYKQAGTYTYLMKEIKGNDETVIYDETEFTATVTVTENSDGTLTAAVAYGDNGSAAAPIFANTKASVAVQVKKVWNHDGNGMTNTWPSSAEAVLFIDGEWPSNGQYIVTLNSSNNWAHVWEDLPKYRLENGQQVEIEYEVYETNVYSDYVVKLEKDETTQENLFSYTITNTYVKKDQKLELKVPVQKIVTGANTDEKFTFKMEARPSDPPAPMPEGAETDENGKLYVTAETTGSASGTTVYFDTIEITAEKVMYDGYSAPYYVTYGWQVSEVIPDDKNPAVTYDEGWYEIMASFQIDEDGKLIFAQRDVWDDDWENIIGSEPDVTIYHYDADGNMKEIPYNDGNFVLPFTNTIETTSVSVNKKWVGGEPADADVTNFLTVHRLEDGKLSDALTDENNNVLRPTRSADGNTYTFSDLPAGYAYAVKEEKVPGYEASYAPMNIGEDAGQDVDKDFALDGETITNTLVSGGFRFTKQDADGNALPGAVFGVYAEEGCTTKLHELTSAADGVVSLTGLDGGKTYYIKEITAPSGYVLNKTVYSVTIEAGVDDKLAGDNGVIVNERSEAEATFSFNKLIANYADEGTEVPVLDFVFTVEPMGAYDDTMLAFKNGYPVDKAFTVTVKGDKVSEEISTSFDLSILKAGTYEFKITEKTDDVPDGWVFSTEEVIVTIQAVQQADGSLTVEKILYCDQEPVLEFYNLYYGTGFFFATKQWTEYNGEEEISLKLYYREDYGEDGYGPWTEYTDDYTVKLDKLGNEPGSEVYWEITIDDLPECMNNKPIRYGVAEIGVDGAYIVTYKATNGDVITEDENGLRVVTHGGTIINERNTTEVSGTKVWADSNNAAGLRPDSITIWLYADNVKTEKSVTLKDGETEWSFTDLPKYDADGKEISYTVQEEAVDGYTTTYSGDGFTITNTLLLGEGKLSFLKYVRNVAGVPYPEESYTFTFALTPDANTPDTYSVAALSYEEEKTPVVVNPVTENGKVTGYTLEKTLKASADGSMPQERSYLQFVFTAPGTYTFTLQEIAPETLPDGWHYDTTPYTVQFEVTEGEGKLNVERKDSSDDPVIKNEWKMTTAGIAKFWQDAGYEDDRFTMEDLPRYITLRYSTDDGTTWVECGNLADLRTEKGLSVTVSDLGAGMWFINVQNLPAYIDGQDVSWSFVEKLPEDSPYETAYGDGGGIFDPEAGLTYAGPTNTGIYNIHDVEMTFEGTKTMEGREMTAADIFTFEITQQGTDNKWTVQNDADGKILFPTFTYGLSDVGTYTYIVKEIGTGINGVTLDTTEYTVTLNVFVMDGQLTVQSIGGANPEALNFVNKYEAVSEITFTGTKTMEGRSMTKDDVFTFEIREVNASGTVLKTWNAQNDETGKIAYPTIRYEQDDVGTHNYIIHETSGDKNGVHVDDTEYTVTVTVTDDGSGKLTVTASGDDYTKLDFVNIYKAQATIQFGGTKTLNGRDLADSEFSFELAEASGNYTGFTKNDADGSYVFAPIFYTQKDAGKTFTYTVKEENTADPDIIYDDTVYTVTVTVIDNGDGTLTLETSGDDYTRLDFENTVKAYSLTLKKTDKLDSDKGLKDAVYGLFAENDPDCQGTPVYTITTGEDGTGKVENMEKGTYWLKEITAPEGYDVDPTPVKVTVPAEDGSADTNLKVDVADYPLGKVKVLKAWAGDTEDKRPASITVQLLKNGQPEGDPIQLTAENNWTAVVENLQMYDPALSEPTPYAYTWTETVPTGYTQTGNVTETDENGVEVTTLTNTYYNASGSIQFAGVKTLTGRALAADEFSFELSGGNLAETEVVKNAADGSFSFSEIKYTEEDIGKTYTYTVKEIIPETKAEGIAYDETVYEIEVTITDNGDGTLKVVATDNVNTIAFVNAFETEGNLQLTAKKTLTGAVLKDGQFTFSLTGDGVQQEKTNDVNGVITFDALTFDQTDIGSTYTYVVKETSEAGNGYTVDTTVYEVVVEVSTDDAGKLKITYTVDGEANKTMTFANAYEADGEIQFSGTKTLTGRALAADEFSFELKNEDGTVIETVKNAADGSFTFSAIQYTLDQVGEYTYTVNEVVGTDSEITYDETIYTIKVTVADNGDGTLKVTADMDETTLNFVNAYEKYEADGEIQFMGTKTLTGRDLAADEFSFELKNEDGTVIETVKNAANGSFTFTAIQYTLDDVGEYIYTVNEAKGTDSEITYDETIYTIKVTVADNGDGTLKVTGDVDTTALNFVNAYEKYEAEGEIQFSGTKTLTGRALAAEEFSFELKNEDGTVIETVKNALDGSFTFTAIQYTLDDVGEYIYTVNEVKGTDSEITYDETIYTIKVTVADNGDGTLKVTGDVDTTALNFVNAYEKYEADGEIQFGGTKTLTGRDLAADEFSFELKNEDGTVIETVKNAADGSFAFTAIQYTLDDVGEYTYTVNEVVGTDSEITYDETIYTIKVTVADNGDGTLKVTADIDEMALNFVNVYEKYEADGEIQFGGTKTLTGRALAADEFSFELKNEDGTVIETVKNALDGSFAFTAIQYTLDDVGEYIYTVNEAKGTDSEITYDETIYTIKVTVADNGDGTLKVTADMDETALNFVNAYEKYEADGELTLDVEKVMNGRAFQSGDSFTFTVSAVSGVPMPERTMVTITPAEGTEAKVDFGKIEYTENDIDKTYTYTVKEVAGNQEGITYDDKFHTVTVKITDNGDGTLKVEAAYADGDKVILTNIYNAEGELTLDVEKTMKGRSFREGDVFTFTVEAAEGVPMPEMAEVVIEPTSGTNAKVDFGKIIYGLEDAGKTYIYTVKETAGSIGGVTYDQNSYTVTVQVNDNGRGGLTVTPVYADGSRVTFVNTYAASGEYQLTARKNLTGKELADKQFTFVLRNEQGKEIETAVNDADGRIAFKAFRFNQNDIGKTYTYYVSERNGAQDGYIYDTTVYTVKLTVADNGDGTLSVEASGIPADGMVFENIFDNNTGVSFVKKWQGKEGPAITLTLYQNGVKMDPQPEYVKNGNVYSYENLPRFDENDKEIVYSAKEAFMDGYLTIYENKTPYQNVTDQVMNGGTIINRSVTDFSVRKEWQGLGKNEEAPAITLTLYCNGEPMNVPTPTPDADGWYTYKNLPGTVNGAEAVYSVVETEVEGFTTSYSGGGDCAMNGDTIVNRKIPKTGDDSMIGLWMAVTAASAGAFLMLMKKRRKLG